MSGRPAVTSRRDVSGSTPSVRRWSDMSSTPSSPREQTASAGAGDASSRILANSGFRALADIGGKLGSAVLYIVLARKVGATDYGVYTFALSFTSLLVVAGGIGQDVVLTREVARDRRRLSEYLANSVASRLVLNLSLLLLAVTIATVAGMAGEARLVILLLGLGAIIDTLLKLVFAVFQAFERLGPVPVVLIAQRWVTTAAALVALYLGGEVVAVAAIYFAVALLAFALGIALVYRLVARPRWAVTVEGCRRVTKEAVPIGVALIALEILFRIDTSMLAVFKPPADVGQYGAAYRLLEASLFVTWSVNAAVLPVLSRLSSESRPSVGFVFQRALKLVLAISLPMAVGAAVLAQPLITTLYGEQYRPAATALALLAPAILLFPVSSLSSALLYSQHRQRVVAYSYAAIVVQNVATNLVLIPRFSYNGAAASTSISELLIAVTLLVISRPQRERLQARRLLAGAVLGGAVAGAVMAVAHGSLPAALLLGAATYVMVLLGVERIGFPDDFAALRSFLDRAHARSTRREPRTTAREHGRD